MIEGALNEISPGLIESAQSMGATPWQIITKVLIPEARGGIITGLTITVVTLVSYPLHARLAHRLGNASVAATVSTTLALCLIVLPFFVLGWMVVSEAANVFPHVQELLLRTTGDGHGDLRIPAALAGGWARLTALLARWHIDLGGAIQPPPSLTR